MTIGTSLCEAANKKCHLPSGWTRTESLATAVTDLWHTLKGIQGADQK